MPTSVDGTAPRLTIVACRRPWGHSIVMGEVVSGLVVPAERRSLPMLLGMGCPRALLVAPRVVRPQMAACSPMEHKGAKVPMTV